MPTPLEQALITLTPTIHTLPPELLDLASSLLAQSRSLAANLKPDEEIGRLYACAHIAASRLQQKLGLEKLVPRPPVPPKVYKKLYGYLEGVLKGASTPKRTTRYKDADVDADAGVGPGSGRRSVGGTPRTPRRRDGGGNGRGDAGTAGGGSGVGTGNERSGNIKSGLGDTPSKSTGKRAVPPTNGVEDTPSKRRRRRTADIDDTLPDPLSETDLPPFIDPMIRNLCSTFSIPSAPSHILAGLETVLEIRGYEATSAVPVKQVPGSGPGSGSGRRPTKPPLAPSKPIINTSRIPALLIVLTLYTLSKLSGKAIDVDEFRIQRAMGIQAARRMEEGFLPSDEELMRDIEGFMKAAVAEGWLEGEWYLRVEADEGQEARVTEDDGESNEGEDQDESARGGVSRRTGRLAKTPLRRKEKHGARGYEGDEESAAGLQPGLGTMFQDAIDWLSAERRAEYRVWEREIRARIQEMEKIDAGREKGNAVVGAA